MEIPVYLYFGETKILLHTLIEPLAFFVGFRYYLYLKKKQGDIIESEKRVWIIIAAIFGALAGSRIIGGLENPEQMSEAKNVVLYFYMNKTVLGGFLGGLFGVELVKKIIKEKKASGDLFVFPIILALIIGRIGCFSSGLLEETYGIPTDLFTGINIGDGQLRHPVTIYEIVFLFFLWIFLFFVSKKQILTNGAKFKIFMISYLSFRFLLDFIKPHYTFSFGLSTIQLASLVGLFWYIQYLIKPRKLLNLNS